MEIKAVLFDLDGTLSDTALDLGGALNVLLRQRGLPELPIADLRAPASHGSAALIGFATGLTPEHPDFESWRQDYLAEYEKCFDQNPVLFEGVNVLIEELAARGIAWGIITNKPATFTDRLVPKLNFVVAPSVVVSGDTCGEAKPSVKPMLYACEQMGVQPENCLYVGDAERDMQAGRHAAMQTVLAEWGYIADSDNIDDWLWDYSARNPLEVLDIVDLIHATRLAE